MDRQEERRLIPVFVALDWISRKREADVPEREVKGINVSSPISYDQVPWLHVDFNRSISPSASMPSSASQLSDSRGTLTPV